ncbi:hypothetical protein GCM10011386_08190 [Parapedobacter defluvii]|uniref:DUF4149 domain-containing protein n=1 Tax=Parapedobacter defluvii TaxID=2045106 RepID=A0ABQ1L6Q2_9SPHI|nr:hypothetical protein [Parapedobacter defluvii]GGC18684.1 hypothetical protein GCM10011386_08190 [Parapedobacter defluvii]
MIYGITLIFLSILAVPSLILSRKPDAKELLAKIEPYQGWIGIVVCFWGVWGLVQAILHLDWLTNAPVWWGTLLAGNIVQAGLGFLLGYPLLNKHLLSGNAGAQQKAERLRARIAPKQGKLGMLGIAVGAWVIIASFLFI